MKKFCFVSVFYYFLYFATSQSNDFVCINSNNPSVINNCKDVLEKNGLKGSKGQKGEAPGISAEKIKSLEGILIMTQLQTIAIKI